MNKQSGASSRFRRPAARWTRSAILRGSMVKGLTGRRPAASLADCCGSKHITSQLSSKHTASPPCHAPSEPPLPPLRLPRHPALHPRGQAGEGRRDVPAPSPAEWRLAFGIHPHSWAISAMMASRARTRRSPKSYTATDRKPIFSYEQPLAQPTSQVRSDER